MSYVRTPPYGYKHQADALLAQAAAAQNTWYTVLDTTPNVRINIVTIAITVANETLEFRATVDGQTLTGNVAATFGTDYEIYMNPSTQSASRLNASANAYDFAFMAAAEFKSFKLEARKTTAAGAGTLYCRVNYDRLE
jgi:hypothetical protein